MGDLPVYPSAMDMLEVIEESRQRAMATRQAAVEQLASFALQAVCEGHDLRRVAKACGFDLDAPPAVRMQDGSMMSMLLGWGPRETTQVERFAAWLGKSTQELVLKRLGENGLELEDPEDD